MNFAKNKSSWKTRFGFYFAAIGSAFGLGNLWRFPYIVNENGGGAFVLLFILFVFIIGMPLLIGELILGKSNQKSLLSIVKELTNNSTTKKNLAKLSIFICLSLMAYFAVISGWVLHFLVQYSVGLFKEDFVTSNILDTLLGNGWLQVLLVSAHIVIIIPIVAREVQDGIERWVGLVMPLFAILLLILASQTLNLDSADNALRYLFYPDFSKLNLSSLGQALGHLLFTLSIGFGAMVTFGSYLKRETDVPIAAMRVVLMDVCLSLFAGLLIFPLVLNINDQHLGPELLFKAIPQFLDGIKGGNLFGVGFFLCLYLAALGASIGILETLVANLKDYFNMDRNIGAILSGASAFLIALIPALSSTLLIRVNIKDHSVLEIIDTLLINWLLPFAALFISRIVVNNMDHALLKKEFDKNTELSIKMFRHWLFVLKWVVPLVIIVAMTLQFVDLFL